MGRVLDNQDLADRLQDAVVRIGPMTRDELMESIVRPEDKTGLGFEAGLPQAILDKLGGEPGGLPLLSFLLEGLCAERRRGLPAHEAHLRLAREAGAIAHRAEKVFERSLIEAERKAAQASRLAYTELLPDERKDSATSFLVNADVVRPKRRHRRAGERQRLGVSLAAVQRRLPTPASVTPNPAVHAAHQAKPERFVETSLREWTYHRIFAYSVKRSIGRCTGSMHATISVSTPPFPGLAPICSRMIWLLWTATER